MSRAPEDWTRVKNLFEAATDLASGERASFLDGSGAVDRGVRQGGGGEFGRGLCASEECGGIWGRGAGLAAPLVRFRIMETAGQAGARASLAGQRRRLHGR